MILYSFCSFFNFSDLICDLMRTLNIFDSMRQNTDLRNKKQKPFVDSIAEIVVDGGVADGL